MMYFDFIELTILIASIIAVGICLKLYKNKGKFFFIIIFCIYIAEVLNITQFPIMSATVDRMPICSVINFKLFEHGFQQTDLLNIIMTIPFGILLPFITKFKLKKKIAANFLIGFVIESLQFIQWLIIGFSLRISDINDIICNFIGACIGTLLFIIFSKIYNKSVSSKKLLPFFDYIYVMTNYNSKDI